MTLPTTPDRVLLFSGHMVDAPGRPLPRFPAAQVPVAARAIDATLDALQVGPGDLAICGGACGGDMLFAEAAVARGVPLALYLPFEPAVFAAGSVDFAGGDWPARFAALTRAASLVKVLPPPAPADTAPDANANATETNPYERNNRCMLDAALRFGIDRLDFIALWNGEGADGPGGTRHLMLAVQEQRGRVHWLDTRTLWT